MKLTNEEYHHYINDKHICIIKYYTQYSEGEITIKKSFLEKRQKKFNRAMKDATIISIKEIFES